MRELSAFEASDGVIFKTRQDVIAHEESLLWMIEVDKYINGLNMGRYGNTQWNIVKCIIEDWEEWKEKHRAFGIDYLPKYQET